MLPPVVAEKFPKAPITEALFYIQIDPVLSISAKELSEAHSEIVSSYPNKKNRLLWETKFEFKEGSPVKAESADKRIHGYQFWSSDEKQVVQFLADGFSFSRLKPYEGWEMSFPEAMKLWKLYLKKFGPQNIKQLGLRYINLIEIPFSRVELGDYFIQPPQPPAGLPQDLEGFLSRLVIRFDERTRVMTTLTPQLHSLPGIFSIVFDIDAFSTVHSSATYGKLEEDFKKLHGIVWDIFKMSIKPKTEELFK